VPVLSQDVVGWRDSRRHCQCNICLSASLGSGELRRHTIIKALRERGVAVTWASEMEGATDGVFGERLIGLIRRAKVRV
jgi:hypothetical protein